MARPRANSEGGKACISHQTKKKGMSKEKRKEILNEKGNFKKCEEKALQN